ncbi:hypothetical protein SYNPS1DRAFT_22286 [Syncephalis pseudoplumigaleata]|uniref:UDENN domain-containing protein n=1 Tax=Syncephalis pseudoplumigaleata TaxID=1712513 RepID=A0A4V1J1Q0_9FUNG|nr:hypothetical protein SYNPS1DRAFT_22286 [Syncephalis pseudoplumigaleata]|eukprot:RKP25829.1 hypothetical protein SYNPS1DRAFT_22286 [Syncephalis pseudoplumigaleata]
MKDQSKRLSMPLQHLPQRVQSMPSAVHISGGGSSARPSVAARSSNEPLADVPLSTPRLRRSSSLDRVNSSLQLDQLQRWIIGFCVVTFDLELGHAMELVYPSFALDADLKQNIFRVRVDLTASASAASGMIGAAGLARCHSSGPMQPKLNLPDITDHDGFLYGYKSLVLLSKQHLPGLFLEMVRRVGAAYFAEGRQVLERACLNIANWPKPSPGKTLLLPLLDTKLQVELPARYRVQLLPRGAALNNPDQYLLASTAPAALYTHSREFLNDLWLCWELVLLGEPIMVLAKGTRECADTVLSLINLIAPIPYGGDWRPYFTVHDSDFKAYSSRLKTPGSVIVGVTNPFFKDAFDHWPNILRVNQADTNTPTRTPSPFERPSLKKLGRQGSGSSLDFVPGLTSKRKRAIDKDTALIKEITTLAQQRVNPHLLNDTIRRYFNELTERFLEPLDRYFATLIPTNSAELTTSQSPPSLKPFRQDEFLKFVQEKGERHIVQPATACSDFYTQFLRCPNFVQWLQMRSVAAERRLRQTHLRALTDANLSSWMRNRTEVELVDMLMPNTPVDQRPTDEQMDQLRAQAELIVNRLPADLKTMLTPAAPVC